MLLLPTECPWSPVGCPASAESSARGGDTSRRDPTHGCNIKTSHASPEKASNKLALVELTVIQYQRKANRSNYACASR